MMMMMIIKNYKIHVVPQQACIYILFESYYLKLKNLKLKVEKINLYMP